MTKAHRIDYTHYMAKLPLDLATQLISLRNILYNINQLCWSFSFLNKQNPMETLTEEDAKKLIVEYNKFVKNIKELVEKVETNG